MRKQTLIFFLLSVISLESQCLTVYVRATEFCDDSECYATLFTAPDTIPSKTKDNLKNLKQDTLNQKVQENKDTLSIETEPTDLKTDEILSRFSRDMLSLPREPKYVSWRFNKKYIGNDEVEIDTSLWMNHLFYPQHNNYETFVFLGNLGSPSLQDHFFSRDKDDGFLFTRYLQSYSERGIEQPHYNVRTPLTKLSYSSGGSRSEAEQVFSVLHTQNASKHINIGVTYDFYGTKGVYRNQEIRDNFISLFGSYYKGNFSAQANYSLKSYRHEENGGITDHFFIQDTLMESPQVVPVSLLEANSKSREQSISAVLDYTFLNIKSFYKDSIGEEKQGYIPLLSTKLIVNYNNSSRKYSDGPLNEEFYPNFFLNANFTQDSVSFNEFSSMGVLEIAQFAKIPGMPGLRGWIGFNQQNYFFVEPEDFLYRDDGNRLMTSHVGVAAFSESPYLSYRGALRVFFTGYRADDKIIEGEVKLSPWRDSEMPELKGEVELSEATPNILLNHYFSNHFKWDLSLKKETRFRIGGVLDAKLWEAKVGYNLIHIKDYVYFGQNATPEQSSDVTVTSAFAQKNFRFWKGFNSFTKVVWQANTNTDVLSIPDIIAHSSLFYERELVKNVLTGQFGFSVFYRSKFYADAYQPAIGQFYNQRDKMIGDYPTVDVFVNFKWKRALIYLKFEHANQGYPNNQYFATYLYPMNPRVFKFGISWIFYD